MANTEQESAWWSLLQRLGDEDEEELSNRLCGCIEPVELVCVCCGDRRVVTKRCKRRWCPRCAPMISARRLERASQLEARMQWPLFLTLTSPSFAAGHAMRGMSQMKAWWKQWRRTRFWGRCVKGGVSAIEVTQGKRGWHIHIHALLDCEWLAIETPKPRRGESSESVAGKCKRAQAEAAWQWSKIVGTSCVIWVQRAGPGTASEVLKYCLKPATLLECRDRIGEVIRAVDAGRLMCTFGECYGVKFVAPEKEPSECESCKARGSQVPVEAVLRSRDKDKRAAGSIVVKVKRHEERLRIREHATALKLRSGKASVQAMGAHGRLAALL